MTATASARNPYDSRKAGRLDRMGGVPSQMPRPRFQRFGDTPCSSVVFVIGALHGRARRFIRTECA
jgi:hypothetical protein